MFTYKRFFILLASLIFASCSTTSKISIPQDFSVSSVELYLARASLNATDFEQYNLNNNTLFAECGSLIRGKHKATQQNIISTQKETNKKIDELVWNIINADQKIYALLKKPGKNESLFDPGKFLLNINYSSDKKTIHTSLDNISSAGTKLEKNILKLTKTIRKENKNRLCGFEDFYGIGL